MQTHGKQLRVVAYNMNNLRL